MTSRKKKNMVIATAMIAVLSIAGISAYFTATDGTTNTFTVGNVRIEQNEENWPDPDDPDSPQNNIIPNKEITKDPAVKNTGNNKAYVYTAVCVPKKMVKVADSTTGIGGVGGTGDSANTPAVDDAAVLTQLFQLNGKANNSMTKDETKAMVAAISGKTSEKCSLGATYAIDGTALPAVKKASSADTWTGIDTWSDDWYLIDVNANQSTSIGKSTAPVNQENIFTVGTGTNVHNLLDHYNVYLFAYGSNTALKAVEPNASTTPVFNSVTFANVLDIYDAIGIVDENSMNYDSKLQAKTPEILVKSFAIQAENVGNNTTGKANPVEVWNILNNEDGAYRNLADSLYDLDKSWETAAVDSTNRSVGSN